MMKKNKLFIATLVFALSVANCGKKIVSEQGDYSSQKNTPVIPTLVSTALDDPSAVANSLGIHMEWSSSVPSGDELVFTIKFDTVNPPINILQSNSSGMSYHITSLDSVINEQTDQQKFFWQVIALNKSTGVEVGGEVWSFTATNKDVLKIKNIIPLQVFYMDFSGNITESITGKEAKEIWGAPNYVTGFNGEPNSAYSPSTDSGYLYFEGANFDNSWIGYSNYTVSMNVYTPAANVTERACFIAFDSSITNTNAHQSTLAGIHLFFEGEVWKGNFSDQTSQGTTTREEWKALVWVVNTTNGTLTMYVDGEKKNTTPFTGVIWDGIYQLSIASGEPGFGGWGHKSIEKTGIMDNIRLFRDTLSAAEVGALYNYDKEAIVPFY